jgi:hypothetical protein
VPQIFFARRGTELLRRRHSACEDGGNTQTAPSSSRRGQGRKEEGKEKWRDHPQGEEPQGFHYVRQQTDREAGAALGRGTTKPPVQQDVVLMLGVDG